MKKLILFYLLTVSLSFGQITTFPQSGGNAATATALAANGANCSAGQYPLGVDASGAVEGCTVAASGSGADMECFDIITAYYPVTDAGGFQYDGTELKYPVNMLAIGEEVQYSKVLKQNLGTDPQCSLIWNFDGAGPTTNNVSFNCKMSCVSDTEDADSQAFATANASGDIVVPGTAGNSSTDSWDMTNTDSCVKGDTLVIEFERTTPVGTSAGTNPVHIRGACIQWTN